MKRRPVILLRSSWQTVNIGDIAHSPGLLRALQRHVPEADLILWPNQVECGVREMLQRHLPTVRLAEGVLEASDRASTPDLAAALAEADFFLHGSAPCLAGEKQVAAWRRLRPGAPYGFFGVSYDPTSGPLAPFTGEGISLASARSFIDLLPPDHLPAAAREQLDNAAFFFARDTLSLRYLRHQALACPRLDFAPDGAFACDLRDEARTKAWLGTHDLEDGKFICVIPRDRYTPRHLVHEDQPNDRDRARAAGSERFREADHAKLRQLIIRWVRGTGLKALVCPEMTYQIALGKEALVDPLPEDVKPHVVWRDTYWLPDEATSVYARACAVVGLENHSPILALKAGTPVLFCRQPTDTVKAQMWPDVGLGHWFSEIDETDGDTLWLMLARIHADPAAARARVAAIMDRVDAAQRDGLRHLASLLPHR